MECSTTVNKTICVEADLQVSADAQVGAVESRCVGRPKVGPVHSYGDKNAFMVNQLLNVRFPVIFTTTATANRTGFSCDVPGSTSESKPHNGLQCMQTGCQNRRCSRNMLCRVLALVCGIRFFR